MAASTETGSEVTVPRIKNKETHNFENITLYLFESDQYEDTRDLNSEHKRHGHSQKLVAYGNKSRE
eukprot:9473671-Heterocapsa_arctica.AAC.1